MSKYRYEGKVMSAGEISTDSLEVQQGVMEEWFYENFEDPANRTPWAEGEYVFIYGGPHEPHDVLQDEFMGFIPEDVILSLADQIGGSMWVPTSTGTYSVQGFSDDSYENFVEGLENIENLFSSEIHNVHGNVYKLFYMLLYVNVISALEVYLSDTLCQQIEKDDALARRFVETNQTFKEWKIRMSDIYKITGSIKKIIDNHLRKFVWHRLGAAEAMYKKTLLITFPKNKMTISRAIEIRHNILHNGGCFENREDRNAVTPNGVKELINEVKRFVSDIEERMEQVNEYSDTIANLPPKEPPG